MTHRACRKIDTYFPTSPVVRHGTYVKAERRRDGTLLTTAAQIVARIRAERELTMSSLAALAGVPTSTISRIESGQIEPTLSMIRRIALGAGYHLHLQWYDSLEEV